MSLWSAPFLGKKSAGDANAYALSAMHLNATVAVPGSKSLTNRYLILAALSEPRPDGTPIRLTAPLAARDTRLMADALRALGVRIDQCDNDAYWLIYPPTHMKSGNINCGLAGTVMRFIPPLAALADGVSILDGDTQARLRPMGAVIEGLVQLGINVTSAQQQTDSANLCMSATPTHLPISIHGTGEISGGTITIDASASSQFVSGLLLAGTRFTNGLDLQHNGGELPSLPHISMTVQTLRAAGVSVTEHNACSASHSIARWHVQPGSIHQPDVIIEPDLSNAAPFMAAAMAAGGQVRIPYWPAQTTQPGAQLPHIFEQMGGHVRFYARTGNNTHTGDSGNSSTIRQNSFSAIRQNNHIEQSTEKTSPALDSAHLSELPAGAALTLEITGPADGIIKPLDMDLHAVGELVPTIAAVAAFAHGVSRLRNIGQLRGHETDRLAALTAELSKIGVTAREEGNDLIIDPQDAATQKDNTVTIESYADHRMATFGAILGLRIPNLYVRNIETTSKTLPNFVHLWETMLAESGVATESGVTLDSPACPSSSTPRSNTASSPDLLNPIFTETPAQTKAAQTEAAPPAPLTPAVPPISPASPNTSITAAHSGETA